MKLETGEGKKFCCRNMRYIREIIQQGEFNETIINNQFPFNCCEKEKKVAEHPIMLLICSNANSRLKLLYSELYIASDNILFRMANDTLYNQSLCFCTSAITDLHLT